MCIFEISSAALNTFRSVQTLRINGPWQTQKQSFVYLLLEQGVLFFCVVAALTVASLVLNFQIPGGFVQRLLSALTLPISGMMTARFLLHLRKWESRHVAFASTSTESHDGSSVLEFATNPNRRNSRAYMDDFGEDPVRRAKQNRGQRNRSLGTMEGIVSI